MATYCHSSTLTVWHLYRMSFKFEISNLKSKKTYKCLDTLQKHIQIPKTTSRTYFDNPTQIFSNGVKMAHVHHLIRSRSRRESRKVVSPRPHGQRNPVSVCAINNVHHFFVTPWSMNLGRLTSFWVRRRRILICVGFIRSDILDSSSRRNKMIWAECPIFKFVLLGK